MPGLSIISVVKDDPEGLRRTLASIDTQGDVDVEVVIVDGSRNPVNPEGLITLPCEIVRQSPRGIYPAMNAGLETARGDYAYFLNAGDTLSDAGVLRRILGELRSTSGADWAFGAVKFYDSSGHQLREPAWSYEAEKQHLFARGVFPAHQGIVARTQALRDLGGFDETYVVAADYKLMLQLSQHSVPIRWEWPIARFEQGGTSTQRWWTALREFHRARKEVFAPRGVERVREMLDTTRHSTATVVARAIGSMHK